VTSSLRVAVVGVGHLGRHHARILGAMPGVELVAVVDVNRARAAEIAAANGTRALFDHRDLLGTVDAVTIAAPTALHAAIGCTFLDAGVPALVEKPLARSLAEADALLASAARGPVLAVFFKISCPTCQYAAPFFQRLYSAYGNAKFTVVGISQNDQCDTAAFIQKFGITFPVLLDDTNTYPASNAYGLTNVPTSFWVAEAGEIEITSVGWARREFEEMAAKAAAAGEAPPVALFQRSEQIADFRAG
jgi:peroxiredoxin